MIKWTNKESQEEINLVHELYLKADSLKKRIKEAEALSKSKRKIDYDQRKTYIKELIKLYEQLADMGNIDAMYELGNLYIASPLNDRHKALQWYERAANLGHQLSLYEIAYLIYEDNPELALQWLDKIRDYGNPKLADAFYLRGELLWKRDSELYPNSKTEALIYYSFAANLDHYRAAFKLGMIYLEGYYENGKVIIPPNAALAGEYMEIAYNVEKIEHYIPEATFRYARMLNTGRGVARNLTKAYLLFNEAAYEGYGRAMVELAQIYVADELFPVDNEMAYLWLLIAQSFECYEYSDQRSRLIQRLVLQLEKKASGCVEIINDISGDQDLNEVIMKPEDYLGKHSYLHIPEAPEITAIATDQEEDKANIEDIDFTDDKVYVFEKDGNQVSEEELAEIIESFDPREVAFYIVGADLIREPELVDFSILGVKYRNYSMQYKKMKIYGNREYQICFKTRNLLLMLEMAIYLVKDDEIISGMIKQGDARYISSINKLFRLLFPFYHGQSPAINRDAGKLNIKLELCLL